MNRIVYDPGGTAVGTVLTLAFLPALYAIWFRVGHVERNHTRHQQADDLRFRVQWAGSDTGSGLQNYTICVSENGGPFEMWLQNVTVPSAIYDGRPNASYAFYSIARDAAHNVELIPPAADAVTRTLDSQLLNVSTRMHVGTGENVLIAGLIITGSEPKRVIIRGIGPSLTSVPGALANPTLELFDANSTLLAGNNDWKSNQTEVEATTIPPSNDFESAIVRTLAPGPYTAVLRGQNNTTGIGVVEVYDLDAASNSILANISSRGFVDGGDNVMIGGLIVGGDNNLGARVLVRAIGPSLTAFGVSGALADPVLELRNANGLLLSGNNDWKDAQQSEIEATTLAPTNDLESAVLATLPAGNYTAIVRGRGNTTGVAVVEVYNLE